MAVADIHPGIAALEAFTIGTLDDASLPDVEAHVAECPSCHVCVGRLRDFHGAILAAHLIGHVRIRSFHARSPTGVENGAVVPE
jgi:hypothetical protein